MIIREKLKTYLYEADRHRQHMSEARTELHLPILKYDELSKMEKFALNTFIFRFSKLQDLMGRKIFRACLEFFQIPTEDMGFADILKTLEKENILDIDTWSLLRELRNDIAHEYPEEMDETIEKINLFIRRSDDLLRILERLERRCNATE